VKGVLFVLALTTVALGGQIFDSMILGFSEVRFVESENRRINESRNALVSAVQSGAADASPLQRMAATERAFAAATAEIGVRDGFLAFFADDAIGLRAGTDGASATVVRAKDGLRARPLDRLPLATRLIWAPFTGHVSADGTLGWLTGGFASVNVLSGDILGNGAYFSVWKRQTDGSWRVWLDEGVSLPRVWQDASPFRVAPDPDAGTAGVSGEPIDRVEQSVAAGGEPWRQRLSEGVRLHRAGVMPLVGREAASAWAAGAWSRVRFTILRTEVAASGDLAVVVGGYDAAASAGATSAAAFEHGTWARVWKRDVTDRWRIVFETSQAAR
jgi:ketosteroid isomerase-like protein